MPLLVSTLQLLFKLNFIINLPDFVPELLQHQKCSFFGKSCCVVYIVLSNLSVSLCFLLHGPSEKKIDDDKVQPDSLIKLNRLILLQLLTGLAINKRVFTGTTTARQ